MKRSKTSSRREEALRQSEEALRFQAKLLDTVEQAVIATEMGGKIIYWNKFAERLYGWKAEEVVGRNVVEIVLPNTSVNQAQEIMFQLRQGKSWSGEFTVNRRDGTTFPAYVIDSPITDLQGNLTGIVGVSIDISERKRSEELLRKSEERLRLLIESADDYAIFTITKDNIVDSWNTGAEHTFGWKEKEILGKSCAILFTPEDQERGVPAMEMQCAAETGKAEDERWHIRNDGSRFFASGVMQPLRDGGIHGFVKICRDQTGKIEAEKALHDKEILQRLVGAQEDERRRIARDLHDELGQKLTALRFKLEAVQKICEVEEVCGRIDEAQLLAKHIDDGVDFLAWELRPAALDDLGLKAALENYVHEWSRHSGVTIEFQAPGINRARLAPEVETNLYRIAQEALNNTYKHAKASHAELLLEKRDGSVILIVEDDGKGFNVKGKKTKSKGLGLIGMKERAALVGGTLEIESSRKQGTTVFVRVPAKFVKRGKENE